MGVLNFHPPKSKVFKGQRQELFFATVCVDTLWIGDVAGLVIVAACYETVAVSRPTPDWFYPGGCVAPLPFCPPYCLVIKLALW